MSEEIRFSMLIEGLSADQSMKVINLLSEVGTNNEETLSHPSKQPQGDENFVKFSEANARDFLKGCSPKTRAALNAATRGPDRFFRLKDVAAELNVDVDKVHHTLWSGITRRTRTITGNPDSYLIDWDEEGIYGDDGETLKDWKVELTQETRDAFRAVLDKK